MLIYALVDGGCHYNQDPTKREAYGSFFIVKGSVPFLMENIKEIVKERRSFGNKTNNEAEYLIIKECLLWCLANNIDSIYIGTDSALVWNQINGLYKIREPRIRTVYDELNSVMIKMKEVNIQQLSRAQIFFYLGH